MPGSFTLALRASVLNYLIKLWLLVFYSLACCYLFEASLAQSLYMRMVWARVLEAAGTTTLDWLTIQEASSATSWYPELWL